MFLVLLKEQCRPNTAYTRAFQTTEQLSSETSCTFEHHLAWSAPISVLLSYNLFASRPKGCLDQRQRADSNMIPSCHLAVVSVVAALIGHAIGSPFRRSEKSLVRRAELLALNNDFPDPSIEQVSPWTLQSIPP